jgi:membrane associated rhomboid family serine protease
MDIQTLHYLLEERFALYAVPTLLAFVLQTAGQPNPRDALGLPVGHASRTLRQFVKATISFLSTARQQQKKSVSFPSWLDWKPLVTFQFIHHDASHFAGNFVSIVQSILVMKFPSWAGTRGWRRGGFLSWLVTTGSIAGALVMDAMVGRGFFKFNNKKSTKSQQNSSLLSDSVSSYVPESVSSAFSWMSNQLPANDWHQQQNNNSSGAGTATATTSSSPISNLVSFDHEIENAPLIMVGISGAAFALVGYSFTYSPSFESALNAAILVGHTVLAEVSRLNGGEDDLFLSAPRRSFFGKESVITAHAAHLGGFFWGAFVGYVCRAIERRRRARFLFRFNDNNEIVDDGRGNRGRVLGGAA